MAVGSVSIDVGVVGAVVGVDEKTLAGGVGFRQNGLDAHYGISFDVGSGRLRLAKRLAGGEVGEDEFFHGLGRLGLGSKVGDMRGEDFETIDCFPGGLHQIRFAGLKTVSVLPVVFGGVVVKVAPVPRWRLDADAAAASVIGEDFGADESVC